MQGVLTVYGESRYKAVVKNGTLGSIKWRFSQPGNWQSAT